MKKTLVFFSAMMAALCAAASAQIGSGSWDFTKGVTPAGGKLRSDAVLTPKGMTVKDLSDFSKKGGFQLDGKFVYSDAFRFEAELVLRMIEGKIASEGAIWDDMYVNAGKNAKNTGMQVTLRRYGKRWTPIFYMGLGARTYAVQGPSAMLKNGDRVKISAVYDANRRLEIEFAGKKEECILGASGPIAPSKYPTIVGNRVGGNYYQAEAVLARLSITPVKRDLLAIFTMGRLAFERAEERASIDFSVENVTKGEVSSLKATMRQYDREGGLVKETFSEMGTVKAGSIAKGTAEIETRVRTGISMLEIAVEGNGSAGQVKVVRKIPVSIGPTHAERMPAVMWNYHAPKEVVVDYGFTHATDNVGFRGPITPVTDIHAPVRKLDDAVEKGLRLIKGMGMYYPHDEKSGKYYRVPKPELAERLKKSGRDAPQPEVGHPEMVSWVRKLIQADLGVFGEHPGFGGVLAVSEKRETCYPSMNIDAKRYKKETGLDIPPEVINKTLRYSIARKRFPDGIVPEDDPLYKFYLWYWHGGDGWPNYFSAIANEYRRVRGRYGDGSRMQQKKPFFSFHDPAVRQPAIWGNGGDVDVLSQWCYATPEPMNVAGPVEELSPWPREILCSR